MNRFHYTQDGYRLAVGDEIWVCNDVAGGEPAQHVVGELLEHKLLYAEVAEDGMVGAKLSSVFHKKENAYWNEYGPRQGFKRTVCQCWSCSIACSHMPGSLIPGDLKLLATQAGTDTDNWEWIKENFRASNGALVVMHGESVRIPTLVPAQKPDGSCVFLKDGKCSVHEVAPYGCSYHDNHMDDRQARSRSLAAVQVQSADHRNGGKLSRVIARLKNEGVEAPPIKERRGKYEEALRLEEKKWLRAKRNRQLKKKR